MGSPERRRAERHAVDLPGELFLVDGRRVEVRIKNLGTLGALVQVGDLEEPVFEAERAVLEHPTIDETGTVGEALVRSACSVVRVDLEFLDEGVMRELALHFDGGVPPAGYEA